MYFVVILVVLISWLPGAHALSSYFSGPPGNCTSCHAGVPSTCNGCHAHGAHSSSAKNNINLSGITNKIIYSPGERIDVAITSGYRTGWVRAILYDQSGTEVARSTGTATGGMGGGAGFPITLSALAPMTPGSYTWSIAWYGNGYDAGGATFGARWKPDLNNPGHGQEIVATNSFTVASPAAPAINLNPAGLDFGVVTAGGSASLATQIQNTGTAALTVNAIAPCAGTSTEFSFSPAPPITIAPGGSSALSVAYAPINGGTDTGCLQVASNDAARPSVTLALTGTGNVPPPPVQPAINLNPASLDFGTATVGDAPVLKTIQIQNTGNAELYVGAIDPAPGTSMEFTYSPGAPLTVAPGAAQTLSVGYTPVDAGTDTGSLQISSTDPAHPMVSLALAGTGLLPPPPPPPAQPAINLSQNALNFGEVMVGGPSATLTTQLQNNGDSALNISNIALCAGTSTEFAFSPVAPFTVAAGSATILSVSYSPLTAAPDAGCLQILSNDPAKPSVNLALAGSGVVPPPPPPPNPEPALSLSPSGLDFGTVTMGSSAAKTVAVKNLGNADLIVGRIALCGGTSTEFTFSPVSFVVAPGTAQNLTATYKPIGEGTDTGCLDITTNDPAAATAQVSLTGSGAPRPAGALDLDIKEFEAGKKFVLGTRAKPVSFTIEVKNTGRVSGKAPATLVGEQNGGEVYRKTMMVSGRAGGGTTKFVFPPYTPNTAGKILWTVTVADGDPDKDSATAATIVTVKSKHDDEEHD